MKLAIDDMQGLQAHTGASEACAHLLCGASPVQGGGSGVQVAPCVPACAAATPALSWELGGAASRQSSWASHCVDAAFPLSVVWKVRGTCLGRWAVDMTAESV